MIIKPLFTVEEPGFKGSGNRMLALAPARPPVFQSLGSLGPRVWREGAPGAVLLGAVVGAPAWIHIGGDLRMGSIHREGKGGPAGCSHLLKVTELLKGGVQPSGNSHLARHSGQLLSAFTCLPRCLLPWEGAAGTAPGTGQALLSSVHQH